VDFGGPDRPDCDEAQVDLLIIHMRRLGFSVELDDSMVQPTDDACGAVAALAAARMSEGDWMSADLSLAVHPNIISNAVVSWLNLGLRAGDECPRLCAYHVEMLYHFFMYIRTPGRGQNGWNGAVFSVLPLDKLWRLVEEDARSLDPLPFVQVCVCNTEVSGMPGSHWFAVAYSVGR
jgi:hypothetical protein